MRRHLVAVGLGLGVLGLGVLAGCSSEPAVFNNEGGQAVSCLTHQTGEPGASYIDPEQRDTGQVFAMMKYYTQYGTMPFCDGDAAGDSDRAWAQVYLDLGGNTDKVPTVMG